MLNAEYDSRTSRLVVVKIVMENFKSYCGVQELGPFHKVEVMSTLCFYFHISLSRRLLAPMALESPTLSML